MNQFSSTHRLILSTLVLAVVAVSAAYFFSGLASLLVAIILSVLLWIFKPLLMPPGYGATRVRLLSLTGVFALAASYGFWAQLVDGVASTITANPKALEAAPWLAKIHMGSAPSISVLIFVVVCVWVVNRYMADASIAGDHPVPLDKDFPDETFHQKLESFCSALRQHLVTTDREANWSPDYYADLEAEVEIVSAAGVRSKKRIADLQEAIRSDRETKAFLVLGDPGGGKSVSLRKLARDMLGEVGGTGRVPIYVNLREWLPTEDRRDIQWTEEKKPTVQELEAFVIENVKSRGDVFTEEFVDQYFRKLWRHGRLFFIFDSFDEIPDLLDVSEESWLINALSDVLSRFISSHRESRGLLASRVFRRPTQVFLAQKILEIRPMSEGRIVQALRRFPTFTHELQIRLFRDRSDLVPIARNPFLMALLGEWVKGHNALPVNQAELYENYLSRRLELCANKITRAGLHVSEVLEGAEEIAWFVFNSPAFGLEAPMQVISEKLKLSNVESIIEILSYARIARVASNESKSFAFVHRRFLEYFVTKRLLDEPKQVPIEHIPTDSRGRDALVLYAQLCDDISATNLAIHCWSEVQEHFGKRDSHLRAIHCLRFLIDAFRARRSAVASFEEEFTELIRTYAGRGDDLIKAKLCLEGAGLLSEIEALPVLHFAMEGENSWLQETAFRACRHLPRLDKRLETALSEYVVMLPSRQFFNARKELVFSLSLSESLKGVRQAVIARYRSFVIFAVAAVIAVMAQPKVLVSVSAVICEIWLISWFVRSVSQVLERWKKKSQSKTNGSSSRKAFLQWISGQGDVLRMVRLWTSVVLLLNGVTALMIPWLPPRFNRSAERELFLGFYPATPYEYAGFSIILCIAAMDWQLINLLFRKYLKTARVWKVLREFLGTTVLFGVPLVVAGLYLVQWLEQKGLLWIPAAFFAIVATSIIVIMIMAAIEGVGIYWRERRMVKEVCISERLTREEIANLFLSVRTLRARLFLVQKIAESKVVASGFWPDNFKLAVTSDPAMTELAKLEERWLRLDR